MHQDLLKQSRRLAKLDAKKPKQANLRRAVSATYYALFHFLVDQVGREIIGAQHDQLVYRQVLGRAFEHATMKSACESFAGGTLKAGVAKGLPVFAVPTEVKAIANNFVELQEKRHLADYDLTERFTRSDVMGLIHEVENAIGAFLGLKASNEKRFFLACLLAWKTLR